MPDSSGRQKTATIGSYRISHLQFIDVTTPVPIMAESHLPLVIIILSISKVTFLEKLLLTLLVNVTLVMRIFQ